MQVVISDRQAEENIVANLRRLRGDRSYSEIARQCGTYPINISRIENGLHFPQPGLLSRLAETLGVTVDELINSQPDKKSRKSSRKSG